MRENYFLIHFFSHFLLIVYGQAITKTSTDKAILRYGFQRTKECQDYQRAFLCMRKCLDLHYDIGHTDKNCVCTCFHRKDKAKYTPIIFGKSTKWRLGAPTTSVPAWAQQHKLKLSVQGYSDVSQETSDLSGEHGEFANSTVVEVGEPTEPGVVGTDIGGNSTVVEGVTGADAGNSTGAAAVNGTAGDVTTVAVTT